MKRKLSIFQFETPNMLWTISSSKQTNIDFLIQAESLSLKKAAWNASNNLNPERGPMQGKAILPYKINYINKTSGNTYGMIDITRSVNQFN